MSVNFSGASGLGIMTLKNNDFMKLAGMYARQLRPLSAMIELTNACNFKCIHCYVSKCSEQFLEKKVIFNLLDTLKKFGCLKISYTGGEPLLHPDFSEIIDYTEKNGFQYTILSNGYLLTDRLVDKFKNSKLFQSIHLSFYGVTPDTHNSVTGVSDSHQKLMDWLRKLTEKNVKFILKTSIMKQNYIEWQNIMEFCDSMNYRQVSEFTLLPAENGDFKPLEYALGYGELLAVNLILQEKYNKKLALNSNYSDKTKFLESAVCVAGKNKLAVSYNGDVFPCISLRKSFGNILNDKFEDIWYNNKELDEIREIRNSDVAGCRDCDMIKYCKYRCPGVSYAYYGDVYRAPEIRCQLAKINREVLNRNEKKIWEI